MCSGVSDWTCFQPGFPIRKSSNHSSVASSSRLIAGSYVLHRLLVPRHPPCALKNLTTKIKDARVHCAVLKLRTATTPHPTPDPTTPDGQPPPPPRGGERYPAGRPARETSPRHPTTGNTHQQRGSAGP